MQQLYANNAKTTLTTSVTASDTSFTVTDGSIFPSPSSYQYFLVTLEVNGIIEIVRVTGRTGNTLYIGTTANRAQEGTSAHSFPAGTRIECRVTKRTLELFSRHFTSLAGVDLLLPPKDSYNEGYVCSTFDPQGNPVVAVKKDNNIWRFLNFTSVQTCSATDSSATTVTASAIDTTGLTAGKFLVQFTSGLNMGAVRAISSATATQITWTTPLTQGIFVGDTFEILKSNSSILLEGISGGTVNTNDDAVVMALIFGEN